MSWEIINRILGLASIDKEFTQKLLEKKVFDEISARDLHELSLELMQKLHHEHFDSD